MDWLLIPTAYLIGSVQWGLLVVKLTKGVDVRTVGSGSTGTTNVLRSAGKTAAIVVLLADAAKGLSVALVAKSISDDPWLQACASYVAAESKMFALTPAVEKLKHAPDPMLAETALAAHVRLTKARSEEDSG